MTLGFGEACVAAQETPAPDVRQYARRPAKAVTPVARTLFCMADGGSANCCKADTQDVQGKDGEANKKSVTERGNRP